MKCRMKKKNEYEEMKTELDNLKAQGVELNIKVRKNIFESSSISTFI